MTKNILITVSLFLFTVLCIGQNIAVSTPILNTNNDSINYALGLANGDGIKNGLFNNLPTEKGIAVFVKSLDAAYSSTKNEALKSDTLNEYALISKTGEKVGLALKEQTVTGLMKSSILKVDFELIKKGLIMGMRANFDAMKLQDAMEIIKKAIKEIEEKKMNPAG